MYSSAEAVPISRPWIRQPVSDFVARWMVVIAPLAIGTIAALLGWHFQVEGAAAARGDAPDLLRYLDPIEELIAYLGVIGAVTLAALAIWSYIAVDNANRVHHSLRSGWFAAIGWLIAPGLGMLAHVTLDRRLHAGSLIGLTVFLAALYVPFGTLGGAAKDLGDSFHLARMWFLSAVVSAFLLIVGMSGATNGLPDSDVANRLRLRAVACYLAALMLVICSALALFTARNLHALVSHRWEMELDPERAVNDPKRLRIKRRRRRLQRRSTPTLFLRVIVTAGFAAVGAMTTVSVFVDRDRAVRINDPSAREVAFDNIRSSALRIGIVAVAVHAVFVVWATVASRNAYRRSIMAPTPWAPLSSFLAGPIVIAAATQVDGPFGDAVLAVGIAVTGGGFVVGQLVLGRTVSSLGGRGRIFLTWMLAEIVALCVGVFVSVRTDDHIALVADGLVQVGVTVVNVGLAWTAMSRLDGASRAFHRGGDELLDNSPPPPSGPYVPAQATVPVSLTSSQS